MVVMTSTDGRHTMSDSSQSEDEATAASDTSKRRRKSSRVDRNSDEYKQRRERNNLAVKKSRSKSKKKTQDTLDRVTKLRVENDMLEAKIKLLAKELSFLKDLFLAHAGSAHGQTDMQDVDLSVFGELTDSGQTLLDIKSE